MTDAKAAAQRLAEKALPCDFVGYAGYCMSSHEMSCSASNRDPVAAAVEPLMEALLTEQGQRVLRRAEGAHYVNAEIRINGKTEVHEADFLRHVWKALAPYIGGRDE